MIETNSSTRPYSGTTRLVRTQTADHEQLKNLTGSHVLLWCVVLIYIAVDVFIVG